MIVKQECSDLVVKIAGSRFVLFMDGFALLLRIGRFSTLSAVF